MTVPAAAAASALRLVDGLAAEVQRSEFAQIPVHVDGPTIVIRRPGSVIRARLANDRPVPGGARQFARRAVR